MSLVIDYLQDISVANGYLTNIGSYVSHWNTQVTPHDDTYDVNVKDITNQHELGHAEVLNVKISLMCKTSSNYAAINKMLLDIHKCLHTNQQNIGNAIGFSGLRILPVAEPVDVILDKENNKGFAEPEFNITHRITERWTPDTTNYS